MENANINAKSKKKPARGVVALERGLSILSTFQGTDGVLTLADLADRTGLYKSTIIRLCNSLERCGYLIRREQGGYRLGGAVLPLGQVYQRSFRLADHVLPLLRELAAASGETASFYVREDDEQVCLHRVESASAIRDVGVHEGDRFPLTDDSALGNVLLAFTGGESETLVSVREALFSATSGVRGPETAAAASPVFCADGTLVGAISLSGPRHRFDSEAVASMREWLRGAAARLTVGFGGDATVYQSAQVVP